MLDVVTENSSEFRDGAGQHVVADEGVGPDGPHQALLGDDLLPMLSEAQEHLHDLGFQASGAGRAHHTVERRLDLMELADAEAVLQRSAPCQEGASKILSHGVGALRWKPLWTRRSRPCRGSGSRQRRVSANSAPAPSAVHSHDAQDRPELLVGPVRIDGSACRAGARRCRSPPARRLGYWRVSRPCLGAARHRYRRGHPAVRRR